MHAALIVTLILATLIVAVLALYLISIAAALRQVSQRLTIVIEAVRVIPGKTQPVPAILEGIRNDLTEAQRGLEGLLEKKLGPPRPPAGPPRRR